MRCRRANAGDGTHFFTANLAERCSDLLVRHVDYIHYNPVKQGWVSRPVDWLYSTLHGCIERGMAMVDWGGVINHGALRCWVSRKAFSPVGWTRFLCPRGINKNAERNKQ